MEDQYVGVWRRNEVKTDGDFSFFYMKVTERDGEKIKGSGFDRLGIFDIKGDTGPEGEMIKNYGKGIEIKYNCTQSPGENIGGTWQIGENRGLFCMVNLSEDEKREEKKAVIERMLFDCNMQTIFWKIEEHRKEFPYCSKL